MSDLVRAHFSTKHNLSSGDKWTPSVTNADVTNLYGNRDNYVKATRISYSITLDVNKLIENIII